MSRKQPHTSEVLYGLHPVVEALRAGRRQIEILYLTPAFQKSPSAGLIESLKPRKTPIETLAPAEMTQLCENPRHQGISARVSPLPLSSLDEIIARAPRTGPHHLLLALDGLTDPHNVGALLRTALASGVDGVLLPRRRTCSPTPTVSRISAGALEHSTLVPVTNLVRSLEGLKARDFWVFGLDREGSQPLYAADFKLPLVLVIGSEDRGLRPLVKTHCDFITRIPQIGPLNSLNASVAGAVAMYEVLRQRGTQQAP